MRIRRKVTGLVAGAGLVAGSLLALGAPAQAYSPDPSITAHTRATGSCPCSISDVIDGTYFAKDPGGAALKLDMRAKGRYIGKLEFHPLGEKLWLYDNWADGDTVYYRVRYKLPGHPEFVSSVYGGVSGGSHKTWTWSLPEGQGLQIVLYDDKAGQDYIGAWNATA